MNFFAAFILLAGAGFLLNATIRRKSVALGLLAGCLGGAGFFELFTPIKPSNYLSAFFALGGKFSSYEIVTYSLPFNLRSLAEMFPVIILAMFLITLLRMENFRWAQAVPLVKHWLTFWSIVLVSLLASVPNMERGLVVLLPAAAIIFSSETIKGASALGSDRLLQSSVLKTAQWMAAAILVCHTSGWVFRGLLSIPFAGVLLADKAKQGGAEELVLPFPQTKGVYFVRKEEPHPESRNKRLISPREYVRWVEDGVRLTKPYTEGDAPVVLSSFNPIDFAAGLRPAKNYPINWGLDTRNEAANLPLLSPDRGHKFLLIPRIPLGTTDDALGEHYKRTLRDKLVLLAQSDYWELFRIKPEQCGDAGELDNKPNAQISE